MAAATLLTDAFTRAVVYWRANAGGTRAGLIAHLQDTVGITQPTATRWVDAMTQEAFDIAMTDAPDYAGFKDRLVVVGAMRALRGAQCVFKGLREGALLQDAKDELLARYDDGLLLEAGKLAATNAAMLNLTAQPDSATRTEALLALLARRVRLTELLAAQQAERDRLASLGA
jgi:hypothetical protein